MSERIVPLEPPYDSEIEHQLKRWMPPNAPYEPLKLFRVLAYNPELMSRMLPLGAKILGDKCLISLSERELIINRVCAVCHCEYEWGVHVTSFGTQAQLNPEQLKATYTAEWDDPIWTPKQTLLVRLVDNLHNTATIDDNLYAQLAALYSTAQIIEMIIMIGWYHTIAFVANSSGISSEQWAARFPTR
jgi:alkylhydroperoxidase family enzyme